MNGWASLRNKPKTPRLSFAKFKPNVRLISPGDLTIPNKLQILSKKKNSWRRHKKVANAKQKKR
jgi:hypothetical protein